MLLNDIDPIQRKVVIRIPAYDKFVNFKNLKISQELISHSKFEFFWRISDGILSSPSQDFENFQNFFGTEVTFSFFNFVTQREVLFKGLIDGMSIITKDGAGSGFLVEGHSHTIAMEDLKHSRIHLDKDLKAIFEDSLKGHTHGMWEPEDIAPVYSERIKSSMQSNEHSWKYLTRLAKNYGEWLYWDGTRLQFGRLKDSKMTLVNGIHLKSFGMGSKLSSNKSSFSGYDYNSAIQINSELEKTEESFGDSLLKTSLTAQKLQYPRSLESDIPFHKYVSNAENQVAIDRMNQLATARKSVGMVVYKAESHVPINVGHLVTVKNKTVDHNLIVTKSTIESVGLGNLVCYFEAIPVEAKQPPYTNPDKHGKAKTQSATVTDNNDPAGMGRLKVKYFWGKFDNESDWIRFPQAHAGSGKGFYFIPEIGEEVLVDFEGGNPDRAFVSGTNYNGSAVSGYGDSGNNVKAIHTRSGTKILLNDAEGSVFIEDPSGNTWLMDGKGNINVNAPKNFSINAGENITLTAGMNVSTSAGMNISETAGLNHSSFAGAMMMQNAVADYSLMAANIMEVAQGERKSKAQKVTDQSKEKKIISEEKNEIHTKGTFNNNSGENSKLH